jgi:hypothetical protein
VTAPLNQVLLSPFWTVLRLTVMGIAETQREWCLKPARVARFERGPGVDYRHIRALAFECRHKRM